MNLDKLVIANEILKNIDELKSEIRGLAGNKEIMINGAPIREFEPALYDSVKSMCLDYYGKKLVRLEAKFKSL